MQMYRQRYKPSMELQEIEQPHIFVKFNQQG